MVQLGAKGGSGANGEERDGGGEGRCQGEGRGMV